MSSVSRRSTLRLKAEQHLMRNMNELKNPFFWVCVLVEFIVCAFVEIIVIWALVTLTPAAFKPTITHFGLFAGFFIMALFEGYTTLSGASMNPAGVWGFFIAGRISLVRMLFFMGAEIAGAATGGMIGYALNPEKQQRELQGISPGEGMTVGMGLAVEAILTFNFMVIALTCTNPETKTCVMPSFPVAFALGTGILAAGTHTGGLQNPIIAFGPAVALKKFSMHFEVYWAGPFIGATVGSVFYTIISYSKKHLDRSQDNLSVDTEQLSGSSYYQDYLSKTKVNLQMKYKTTPDAGEAQLAT